MTLPHGLVVCPYCCAFSLGALPDLVEHEVRSGSLTVLEQSQSNLVRFNDSPESVLHAARRTLTR